MQDRFFEDSRNIFNFDVTVEDALRINHNARSVFTLIETAGRVGSDKWSQAACFDFCLKGIAQRFRSFRVATPARMTGYALIAADKKMMCEGRHVCDGFPPSPIGRGPG